MIRNPQNWRTKGNATADITETEYLGTWPNRRGRILVFSAGASHSLNEWEMDSCCFSCAVLLAVIGKQDSEHPDKAAWKIHRPRENLLDWNYNLPCNEDNWAHGTPRLLLTPHLWHHFSLRKYEITRVVLEQSFHPGASRVRAVCFILSSLFPTHFLFLLQRNKWTLCDLCFRKVSSPKLLNRLSAASQLTDGWKWQQCCKELSKLFPSRDWSPSLHYVAFKHFPSTWMNICVSFTEHEQNLSEPKFPTSRRLVIFGVIIRPWAKT